MTAYLPGPYQVTFEYNVPLNGLTLKHEHSVNCKVIGTPAVGDPASSINVATKGLGSLPLNTAIDQYWALIRAYFSSATTVTAVTLWRVPPGTSGRDFITAYTVSPAIGAAGPAIDSWEATLSFRTGMGSVLMLNFLEGFTSGKDKAALISNPGGSWAQQIAYYVLSANGWITARDRTFPVAPMSHSEGENEHTFERRHRAN